jgi:6-hydroxycyclohex-1-ene-1-carbonyl-CoA dehydrogenase
MASAPDKIKTWQMTQPTTRNKETKETIPGKLDLVELPVPELKAGEVLVEVAGCGVCHTDLGFFYDGVPTVCKPPLTLGHEISGTVVAGDAAWVGKEVIIPAVMPCRQCLLCKTRRGNRCLAQKMPGNSLGIYGGFASHIPVPSVDLCVVPADHKGIPLEHLAVVADAVTTPFQAAKRASLDIGDNVIVIGIGGVGQYMVQTAKALGAGTVIAIAGTSQMAPKEVAQDYVKVLEEKLQNMTKYGADFVINAAGKTPRDLSGDVRAIQKKAGLPAFGWKIFEATGSSIGQDTALNLLSFTGTLVIIGFGMGKVEYSLSRLMAFDADIIGTWGCLPEYYPQVLDMVLKGKIDIAPYVQTRKMSTIRETFAEAHRRGPDKRIVLTPDM